MNFLKWRRDRALRKLRVRLAEITPLHAPLMLADRRYGSSYYTDQLLKNIAETARLTARIADLEKS